MGLKELQPHDDVVQAVAARRMGHRQGDDSEHLQTQYANIVRFAIPRSAPICSVSNLTRFRDESFYLHFRYATPTRDYPETPSRFCLARSRAIPRSSSACAAYHNCFASGWQYPQGDSSMVRGCAVLPTIRLSIPVPLQQGQSLAFMPLPQPEL